MRDIKKPTNKSGEENNQKDKDAKHKSVSSQSKDRKRISELEGKLKELALTIDEVEDEKLDVENKLKKVLADYQNLESQIDKRIELKSFQLKKQLGTSLMTLMDDIQFGLAASQKLELSSEVSAWMEGMKDTIKKMEKVLTELDISLMDVAQGDQFDSNQHEALATVPNDENNKIVEVVQPGYIMGDLVVRPARVVVGKKT